MRGSPICSQCVRRAVQGSNKWKEAQLADTLDPHAQARAAMALNLDLMKWRAAPRLDLDAISSKRCLLLGGTPPTAFSNV